jgi:hypothetical protein
MIFVRSSFVRAISLPEYSSLCLLVIAAWRNSRPLSDCSIIGGPMIVNISNNAYAMHDALLNLRGILKRNLIPWSM